MAGDEFPDSYATHASILLRLNEADPAPREIAWQQFHDVYAPIVAGFARNLGARPNDLDDVVQEVMLGFFRASPEFVYDPAKGRFRGFLKVCTFRALRNLMRARRKMETNRLDDLDPESPELARAWEEQWDQEMFRRALQEVRQDYDEPSRRNTFRAFELYAILGKSSAEVARELDMEINSVHKAKERITRAVRARIDQLNERHG